MVLRIARPIRHPKTGIFVPAARPRRPSFGGGEDEEKISLGTRDPGEAKSCMLRHSETWEGMISNLGDAWDQLKLRVGRGGFFEEEPACRFSRSD